MSFDLVDEPWVLVDDDGAVREVSLAQAFEHAHELRGLHGEIPTQEAAMLRLLLAILYRALPVDGDDEQAVEQWAKWWAAPTLPSAVGEYLLAHRDRFDLFDPDTPFLQSGSLQAKGTSGLTTLVADVPPKHPFFTTRAGSALGSLRPAEAARWLVHTHAFDPSGIKTGALDDARVKGGKGYPIGTGWAGNLGLVLLQGRTLKETLLLNLVLTATDEDDRPVWERPALTGAVERSHPAPKGPADLLTWPSRRIRLLTGGVAATQDGGNPDDGVQVVDVIRANGDPLTSANQHRREPYSAWRRSPNQEKKLGTSPVYMPATHSVDRSLWRGLPTLLPGGVSSSRGSDAGQSLPPGVMTWVAKLRLGEALPPDYPLVVRAVGMTYGTQSSVVTATIDDRLSISADLIATASLHTAVERSVNLAEKAAYAVGDLARNLARACGRDGEAARSDALEQAFYRLGQAFAQTVPRLRAITDSDAWEADWRATVRRIAFGIERELVAAAPEQAFVGRDVDIQVKGQPTRSERLDAGLATTWFRLRLHRIVPRDEPPAPGNPEATGNGPDPNLPIDQEGASS